MTRLAALLITTLTEGGDGYCLHATLQATPGTRDMFGVVRGIGARCGPAIPLGPISCITISPPPTWSPTVRRSPG